MEDTLDILAAARKRRLSLMIIAFPIVMVGGGLLVKALHLGWIGLVGYLIVATIMTMLLVHAAQARAELNGCASPAMRRYNRRMMVATMAYMAILFLSIFAFKNGLTGALLWVAAISTALPVLGMIWAMTRLVMEETDEYLRSRVIRQALIATAGLLAVSTVWGFFEQFNLAPHIPAWASLPIFAMFLGLSNLIKAKHFGGNQS